MGDTRVNPSPAQVAARVLDALEKGERIHTAVVTDSADPSLIGRRWWRSGRRNGGTLGSPSLDAERWPRRCRRSSPPGNPEAR